MLLLALGERDARPSDLFTQFPFVPVGQRACCVRKAGRQPPGTRGDGGESSEAMVRQTPTLPVSVVLFPWPRYQPKLLQQLGTEQGASPQVISARASPW